MNYFGVSINRTACDVFKEMRMCVETNNYSYLSGLIEEAQVMANKMEAGLYDKSDYESIRKEIKRKKKKLLKLEKQIEEYEDDEEDA